MSQRDREMRESLHRVVSNDTSSSVRGSSEDILLYCYNNFSYGYKVLSQWILLAPLQLGPYRAA